jgi:putative heme-binding domain-containing protein
LAVALAGNLNGAETLLDAVEHGKVSARLLQSKTVKDRLSAAKIPNLNERVERLTKPLPTENAERQKLIEQRINLFYASDAAATAGAEVFKQNCAVCHSIDGQGAAIGPQLDGAGNRGAERLVEDVLDPSRNVDPAFRVTLFTMKNGELESGLIRREEGETIVIADGAGKEHSIRKGEIESRRESALSLMPDNFSELLKPADFNHLIAFLVSKGKKAETPLRAQTSVNQPAVSK